MPSVGIMLEQVDGLTDTKDLNDLENEFVTSVYEKYVARGKKTNLLTAKQVEVIEKIWKKHFA